MEETCHRPGKDIGRTVSGLIVFRIKTDPGRIDIDAVHNDKVEPPVAVIIQETGRSRPSARRHVCLRAYVLEFHSPQIQEQTDPTIHCDEDVWLSIVVHIADSHAGASAGKI